MCEICIEELKKPVSWAQYSFAFRNGFETCRDISKPHTDKLSADLSTKEKQLEIAVYYLGVIIKFSEDKYVKEKAEQALEEIKNSEMETT